MTPPQGPDPPPNLHLIDLEKPGAGKRLADQLRQSLDLPPPASQFEPASNDVGPTVSVNGNNNGRDSSAELSDDARDVIETLLFVWLDGKDANCAAQVGNLDCAATTEISKRIIRERQIVVVSRDDDEGAAAKQVAQRCVEFGAYSVRIWTIPDFGSKFPSMREWCQHYSFVNYLEIAHGGKHADFVSFVNASSQVSPDFPEDPRPIEVDLLPVPGLDPRMIPVRLRGWLVDIANRGSFPLEYPAGAALVGLSGLIGRRIAIRPKRHDNWLVIPNLWGAAVGPPGIQKSPAIEEALRPLKRLVADAIAAHKDAVAAHLQQQLVAVSIKGAAKKKLESEAKKGASKESLAELAREALAGDDALRRQNADTS